MKKKEKKQNKKFTIYKLFGTLLLISSLILLGMVLYINVLPIKYLQKCLIMKAWNSYIFDRKQSVLYVYLCFKYNIYALIKEN